MRDRDAIATISIEATWADPSEKTHNISLDQWKRIRRILNEPVYVQQFVRGDREAPMACFLDLHEARAAIGSHIAVETGIVPRNIQFDANQGVVTYET